MSTLFLQHSFQPKPSIASLRTISSLVHDNDHNSSNPFHLFYLQAKTRTPTTQETKTIHAHTLKTGLLHSDIFVANSLIAHYCKSTTMSAALKLFEEMLPPNLISWNIMITGYNQSLQYEESWRTFCRMRALGFQPNASTYGSVLSSCTASRAPHYGMQVYSLVLKHGYFSDGYVRTGMIDMFSKSFCFEEALRVFLDVSCENVVCWNAIISGAVRNSKNFEALDLFCLMVTGCSKPNEFTFPSVLTACTAFGELEMGKGIHGWVIKCGLEEDVYVGTAVIDFYAKFCETDEAVKEFLLMPVQNVVSWTAIISAFSQKEDSLSALQFFKEMNIVGVQVNNYTITSVLSACVKPSMVEEANQLHSWILKSGFYTDSAVKDSLVNVYSKTGEICSAEKVFREMGTSKNVEAWAVMISGFAQNGNSGRAIELFRRMSQEGLRPNKYCCSSVLSGIDSIPLGRQMHSYILKAGLLVNISVGCALFTMYSKNDSLEDSYKFFRQIEDKDEVSWTSMIAGFAEHGCAEQAFQLFRDMVAEKLKPDLMTLSSILVACSTFPSLRKGKEVHGYTLRVGVREDVLVGDTLLSMYSKCGSLRHARRVFDLMPTKDQISWSSLISGYAQNGHIEDSISLYNEMLFSGYFADSFTLSPLLRMAATLTKLAVGKQLHATVVKTALLSDLSVGSSLVTMYSKCGNIDESHKVFDKIENPDLFTWTAMIVGYAQHGRDAEALRLFEVMRGKGIKPDAVTFVGALSACSHIGLVEEGYFYLNSMTKGYGIKPTSHHYGCMVDLLGRSGKLQEAVKLINNMPIEPDALVWGTLLAACKVHGDVELGKLAAKKVFMLKPSDSGAYVSLSNILADTGLWEQVLDVRSLMEGVGLKKERGWSSV